MISNLTIHGTGVKPKLDFFVFRESMNSLASISSDMKFMDTDVDFGIIPAKSKEGELMT